MNKKTLFIKSIDINKNFPILISTDVATTPCHPRASTCSSSLEIEFFLSVKSPLYVYLITIQVHALILGYKVRGNVFIQTTSAATLKKITSATIIAYGKCVIVWAFIGCLWGPLSEIIRIYRALPCAPVSYREFLCVTVWSLSILIGLCWTLFVFFMDSNWPLL